MGCPKDLTLTDVPPMAIYWGGVTATTFNPFLPTPYSQLDVDTLISYLDSEVGPYRSTAYNLTYKDIGSQYVWYFIVPASYPSFTAVTGLQWAMGNVSSPTSNIGIELPDFNALKYGGASNTPIGGSVINLNGWYYANITVGSEPYIMYAFILHPNNVEYFVGSGSITGLVTTGRKRLSNTAYFFVTTPNGFSGTVYGKLVNAGDSSYDVLDPPVETFTGFLSGSVEPTKGGGYSWPNTGPDEAFTADTGIQFSTITRLPVAWDTGIQYILPSTDVTADNISLFVVP